MWKILKAEFIDSKFILIIPYFIVLSPLSIRHIASSSYAVLLFNLVGIGFTGINVVLFGRRNSYLE